MQRFIRMLLRDHFEDTNCGLIQGIDILARCLRSLRLCGIFIISPLRPLASIHFLLNLGQHYQLNKPNSTYNSNATPNTTGTLKPMSTPQLFVIQRQRHTQGGIRLFTPYSKRLTQLGRGCGRDASLDDRQRTEHTHRTP